VTGTNIGPILALVGCVVRIFSTWGGRGSRRTGPLRQPVSRRQRLAGFAAIALIVAGLVLMWAQK
jgi:hypothetical protein